MRLPQIGMGAFTVLEKTCARRPRPAGAKFDASVGRGGGEKDLRARVEGNRRVRHVVHIVKRLQFQMSPVVSLSFRLGNIGKSSP